MKTSIALIGFMGTGKSVVGGMLAARLGKDFIDLDAMIEEKAGRTIPEIFRRDGEIGFRELEIEAAREVSGRKNAVIACGGGIVLNKINIDRLKKECIIVYLAASPGIILRRTSGGETGRPLLPAGDSTAQIKEMLRFRRPFYERAADIKINTSKLDTDSVVGGIIEKLKEHEDNG